MLLVAAGSAAAAATKERIVASFIVAASWLAAAGPVLGTARLYESSIGGAYRFRAEKVQRRHLSVSKQISLRWADERAIVVGVL